MKLLRRRFWGVAVVVVALAVVAVAAYFGIRGLTLNPIVSTDASGVTTISGSFQPYGCGNNCNQGYVQAGARSVFVIFPSSCPQPPRDASVTVRGRLDSSQGSGSYRLIGCGY